MGNAYDSVLSKDKSKVDAFMHKYCFESFKKGGEVVKKYLDTNNSAKLTKYKEYKKKYDQEVKDKEEAEKKSEEEKAKEGKGLNKSWLLAIPIVGSVVAVVLDYVCEWGFIARLFGRKKQSFVAKVASSNLGKVAGIAAVGAGAVGGYKLWQHYSRKKIDSSSEETKSKTKRSKSKAKAKGKRPAAKKKSKKKP